MTKTETGRKRETETVSPGSPCVRLRGCRGEGRCGRRRRNAKLEGRRARVTSSEEGRRGKKALLLMKRRKKEKEREREREREAE